jgi:hypothetical protein
MCSFGVQASFLPRQTAQHLQQVVIKKHKLVAAPNQPISAGRHLSKQRKCKDKVILLPRSILANIASPDDKLFRVAMISETDVEPNPW